MYLDDRTRARHMLDYALRATNYAHGRDRRDLDEDEVLALALTRCLEIVGEAAAQTSPEYREAHPDIPWGRAIGMRNRLIHAYVDINLDILWTTITADLPPLIADLQRLVSSEARNSET